MAHSGFQVRKTIRSQRRMFRRSFATVQASQHHSAKVMSLEHRESLSWKEPSRSIHFFIPFFGTPGVNLKSRISNRPCTFVNPEGLSLLAKPCGMVRPSEPRYEIWPQVILQLMNARSKKSPGIKSRVFVDVNAFLLVSFCPWVLWAKQKTWNPVARW